MNCCREWKGAKEYGDWVSHRYMDIKYTRPRMLVKRVHRAGRNSRRWMEWGTGRAHRRPGNATHWSE